MMIKENDLTSSEVAKPFKDYKLSMLNDICLLEITQINFFSRRSSGRYPGGSCNISFRAGRRFSAPF